MSGYTLIAVSLLHYVMNVEASVPICFAMRGMSLKRCIYVLLLQMDAGNKGSSRPGTEKISGVKGDSDSSM